MTPCRGGAWHCIRFAIAPRNLIFLDEQVPPAFQWTNGIYQLHGQAQQITASGSLPEALEIWKYD